MASLGILRNPRWPPKWSSGHKTTHYLISVALITVNFVFISRLTWSVNALVSKLVHLQLYLTTKNPIWPPKWLPQHAIIHKYTFRQLMYVNLVCIYKVNEFKNKMESSLIHLTFFLGSKNLVWRPKWLPKYQV